MTSSTPPPGTVASVLRPCVAVVTPDETSFEGGCDDETPVGGVGDCSGDDVGVPDDDRDRDDVEKFVDTRVGIVSDSVTGRVGERVVARSRQSIAVAGMTKVCSD